MKVLILLSFVAVAFATPECGENSHYESCGTACEVTCKNYQNPPKFCVLMCNPGCHCDEGYVKTDDGRCVAPEECPALTDDEVCGENEVYNGCGTACPLTCDNYQNPPKICTLQCIIGCECAKGFVKSRDGRCVRPEECPASGSNPLTPVECGENEVFKTCGTACPLTCDNYQNPPKFCTLQCIIGCACENGFVKTRDGRCVRPEECPASAPEQKTCLGEAEPGMCKAYIPSYYYDGKSGQCKRFIYGGCGGNGNRYSTEEECKKNCGDVLNESTVGTCEQPPETGPCRAFFPRYFFNKVTGKCEKFVYGGCQGNSNNFETSEKCEQTCGVLNAVNACEQPQKTGPCRGNFKRFFFNKSTGKCEEFVYGGCLGNSNNFRTSEACEEICGQSA